MDKPNIFDKTPAQVELEPDSYSWCACGLSSKQPFCDGSHKESGFSSVRFEITEKKQVYLCNCKQTGNPPFCDGTHKSL